MTRNPTLSLNGLVLKSLDAESVSAEGRFPCRLSLVSSDMTGQTNLETFWVPKELGEKPVLGCWPLRAADAQSQTWLCQSELCFFIVTQKWLWLWKGKYFCFLLPQSGFGWFFFSDKVHCNMFSLLDKKGEHKNESRSWLVFTHQPCDEDMT